MVRSPRRALLAAVAACALAFAGYAAAGGQVVTISAGGVKPSQVDLAWGDTVRFTNADTVPHTLRLSDGSGEVHTIDPGATFSAVFSGKPGTERFSVGGGHVHDRGFATVAAMGQLTLETPVSSLTFGQKLVLSGHTSVPGQVWIETAPLGSGRQLGHAGAWTDIAAVVPGADGSFAFTLSPAHGARYRATTAGGQLRSPDVHVDVTPAITAAIGVRMAALGGTVVVRAHVVPAGASKGVVLTRFDPAKKYWVPVAHAALAGGHAVLRWKADEAGLSELRVELDPLALGRGYAPTVGMPVAVSVAAPPSTVDVEVLAPVVPGGPARVAPLQLSAHAGRVTIRLQNLDLKPHNLAVRGGGIHAEGRTVATGGTSTVTAQLARGKYELYSTAGGGKGVPAAILVVR